MHRVCARSLLRLAPRSCCSYVTPSPTASLPFCVAVAYSVEGGSAGIPARNAFNAVVSGHDLLEYYLPAFQACFMQGGGRSSMCSYNAVRTQHAGAVIARTLCLLRAAKRATALASCRPLRFAG